MNVTVIILAAGYATRLYPLTLTRAKPLLPVAGKPMIDYVLDNLAPIGSIERVIIVTNAKFAAQFQKWADDYRATKAKLVFTIVNDGSTDDTNKLGAIVVTAGNKSEMATGYATLYGDMAGGFAVIKDIVKTLVYRIANWRNTQSQVIPQRVIDRAPSAELAEGQTDQDLLPPYEVVDAVVERYMERDLSAEQIASAGFDLATVREVVRMIRANEYKRRQAPPGVRITPRGFGKDWRYPITSGFR